MRGYGRKRSSFDNFFDRAISSSNHLGDCNPNLLFRDQEE